MNKTRQTFKQQAEKAVATFVRENAGFAINRAQPVYRGGTNLITLGTFGDKAVVYKYFCTDARWQNEVFCLEHFRPTGYMPQVLVIQPRLIVMGKMPGTDLDTETLTPGQRAELSRQFGAALGHLAAVPLPSSRASYSPVTDFAAVYWSPDLGEVIRYYLKSARQAAALIEAYHHPFFSESLALVERQVESVETHRKMLYHEDVSNARSDGARFCGFYDLEMCRLGTEFMQLGVAARFCGPDMLSWSHIVEGYTGVTNRTFAEADHTAILAMNHFYCHQRVLWGRHAPTPAELEEGKTHASEWLAHMKHGCDILKADLNVRRWFPSLNELE